MENVKRLTYEQTMIQQKLQGYPSLKSLQILNALSFCEGAVGITTICDLTGLSNSSVHRILQDMVECGYVTKDTERKKYRYGFEAMAMALRFKHSNYLLEAARSEMKRLNDLSNETIHLIAIDGYEGVYIGKLDSKNQIGLRSVVGRRIPLYCTGGGKAILSHRSQDWLYDYLLHVPLKRFTDFTIQDRDTFYREMELIKKQGYSLDRQEHNPDVTCIAAPIVSREQNVECSIGIAAPAYRFSMEDAIALSQEVIDSAARISKRLLDHE